MIIRLALAAHNTEKCFEHQVFGLNLAHSKVIKSFIEAKPDDILVFYKAKEGFAGIWKITSSCYTDKTPIWKDAEYPTRVKIKPVIPLRPDQYVDARTMVEDLDMVTHPQYWGIAFRENLKEITQKDYELIKRRLEEANKG
jgi:predicted RNA-binding protein